MSSSQRLSLSRFAIHTALNEEASASFFVRDELVCGVSLLLLCVSFHPLCRQFEPVIFIALIIKAKLSPSMGIGAFGSGGSDLINWTW